MSDDFSKIFLQRAEEELVCTKLLLNTGHFALAASRSYYAAFYAVSSLLSAKGMHFKKHTAVISTFAQEFCLKGLLPVELHRKLLDLHDLRGTSDYDITAEISKEDAEQAATLADDIVSSVKKFQQSVS